MSEPAHDGPPLPADVPPRRGDIVRVAGVTVDIDNIAPDWHRKLNGEQCMVADVFDERWVELTTVMVVRFRVPAHKVQPREAS